MMKYENARDLLPEALLKQVQKYISGKTVYIPAREQRKKWGQTSGCRQELRCRNQAIYACFAAGVSIEQLADDYGLSCDTIKRIVYSKKESVRMKYQGTLSSAREWSQLGMLEEWVHAYLLADGNNKPFSDGLKIVDRRFLGPCVMPLSLFCRCTGPVEEGLPYQIHSDVWERHVRHLMERITACGQEMPPLIVHYWIPEGKQLGEFELNDGNHRWEAYTRLGITEAPVIVWITDENEYEQFVQRYGKTIR